MTFRLQYQKILMSGSLVGLPLECSYEVPNYDIAIDHLGSLMEKTEKNPGRDCVTGTQFYIADPKIVEA
jgi:hypothetical protein